MSEFLAVLIGVALVNNLLVEQAFGADASRAAQLRSLGAATTVLVVLGCPAAWLLQHGVLQPLALQHLQLLLLLGLMAPLAWLSLRLVAWLRPKDTPSAALWPLLLINGTGLGCMLLSPSPDDFRRVLTLSIGAGLAFWLALQLLTDLFERIRSCPIPAAFQGAPVYLISAGLMGLAFLGLSGLVGV